METPNLETPSPAASTPELSPVSTTASSEAITEPSAEPVQPEPVKSEPVKTEPKKTGDGILSLSESARKKAIEAGLLEAPEQPESPEPTNAETPEPETPPPDKLEAEALPTESAEPMPEGLTKKAQERFQFLSGRAKQAEAYENLVNQTGANAEQLQAMFGYVALANSGTPENLARAYDIAKAEFQALAKRLGKAGPGFDPIAEHPDLHEGVETLEIDRAHADELAQARARERLLADRQSADQQARSAQQARIESARLQLNTVESALRAADPEFDTKLRLIDIAALRTGHSPEQWASAFVDAYRAIKPPAPTGHVALRPTGQPAPAKAPTSPAEAFAMGAGIRMTS